MRCIAEEVCREYTQQEEEYIAHIRHKKYVLAPVTETICRWLLSYGFVGGRVPSESEQVRRTLWWDEDPTLQERLRRKRDEAHHYL